ncbi:MAG: twin-arginine translocase TatA/TatE family subunit [Hydrogenobacter thermophilus]|uniref:Sec-independent protein translocase protein TatA n=1 Tax=Hydrogenobacter thermophilus (strain DSM 6534 / IAM 12695 / TK-6) TaxID=608538 RepID=D3DGL4_HYDTT|nr:twin-arginine translocase TatA/TatE family subunit [Hydrogenobacter thermophilus]ADO44901.1 twin-arginine translocation protein, TatA/E family subunit [Hydrogenobacter thermophilus TK-6]QWK20065.1 MAG: twin-arginine translocase TatA/TatE family subunit [Hydrogenobacter thermophilus]BAI68966.1 twin-arginine translocation protein TatA/E family subunit [Hydrogenobacter thermophilus TK-6]
MHFPLPWQLILILLVVFVIFGASRLPELGKGLGEGIRNFKKALSGEEEQKKVPEKEGG